MSAATSAHRRRTVLLVRGHAEDEGAAVPFGWPLLRRELDTCLSTIEHSLYSGCLLCGVLRVAGTKAHIHYGSGSLKLPSLSTTRATDSMRLPYNTGGIEVRVG